MKGGDVMMICLELPSDYMQVLLGAVFTEKAKTLQDIKKARSEGNEKVKKYKYEILNSCERLIDEIEKVVYERENDAYD
jgi:hypothetical protein